MNVVCAQMDIAWEDKQANFVKVRSLLDATAVEPGGLIVLAEMFSTGFSMNVPGIFEGKARLAERFLIDLAAERGAAVLGGVVTLASAGRGSNEALLVDPQGRLLARYRKMHPFSYAGETERYEAGGEVAIVDHAGARLSPFICYDLRFPEAFRSAAAQGAEVFVVIANWPAARADHWRTLLRARAIENQAYVIGVNRVGRDPNAAYAGGSLIVGPRGQVLADAGAAECTIAAELDLSGLRDYRREFPALADIKRDWVRIGP